MSNHSPISPSASYRYMKCAGSYKLIQSLNIISGKPSDSAIEGTAVHKYIELNLKNPEYRYKASDYEVKLSSEMRENGQKMIDYVNSYRNADYEIFSEEYIDLSFLKLDGFDGGTADAVILSKDRSMLEIVDYKNGTNPVYAFQNSQLMIYAVGAVHKFGIEKGLIKLTIIQPNVRDMPDSYCISYKELMEWRDMELVPSILRVLSDNPPFYPEESVCKYCPASGYCEHQKQYLIQQAQTDFTDTLPDISTLSYLQKLRIVKYATHIQNFIDAVKDTVLEEMKAGKQYEGLKLVRKNTRRKLVEGADDVIMSPLLDYLTEDEIYTRKMKSLSELEKLLKSKTDKKTVDDVMNSITVKPLGEIEVTTIDDKRKSIEEVLK